VIGSNIFSLFLAHTDQDSKIWFGGYDSETIRGMMGLADFDLEESIQWVSINSSYYWSIGLQAAKIGLVDLQIAQTSVILDSGSSINYIPAAEYTVVVKEITNGHDC
jgi:hypothetical protein